ncbi:hypothetical protein ACXDF8_26035 [Mycolicibacterium sp. CBM1]
MVLLTSPSAFADPDPVPGGGALLDSPTLSLSDLGAEKVLSFYGSPSSTTVSFPVPVGLMPSALNLTLNLPFNVRSGLLTVMQGDRLVGKQALPLADLSPVTVPLSGIEVADNVATITLTMTSAPEDGYCLDRFNPIELINGSVTFTGTEIAPTTVADFLPPIVRALTIGLPANPTQSESDATIQLAAALVKRYGNQGPAVTVVPLPDGATTLDQPAAPLERQILVKEGPDEAISLLGTEGVPQLLISGPADKLADETRLLGDGALGLALTARVVPDKLSSGRRVQLPGDVTTVAQLGQTNLTSSGVSPQVRIGFDQTRLGHPVQGVRVHLIGTYTPLPSSFGAQIRATVNGEDVDSWAADPAGVLDRWIDVPDRLLTRYTDLQVAVNTTGSVGGCNDYQPIMLTIDGTSVVQTSVAVPPIPPGLGALPQALMPAMQVGLGTDKFNDTVRAAQIIVGLQRISALPLRTTVTSIDQARASQDPALLISADGWTDKSITLPVSADERRIIVDDQGQGGDQTILTLDPGIQFGSLQTVFDGHRSLLIATSNGAPAELDRLLQWLNADRSRWPQLRGAAIIAVAGRDPQLVAGRTPAGVYGPAVPAPNATEATPVGYRYDPAWWAAAGVVGIAAAFAAAIAISARRAHRTGATHRRGE